MVLGLFCWTACGDGLQGGVSTPTVTLADASEQVTFASTEDLGPHRFVSTWERTENRGGSAVTNHKEVTEILWEDWDHFVYRRRVDGRDVEAVVVYHGQAWIEHGDSWRAIDDAEPYRTQLRMTWNIWERVTDLFGERVVLTANGVEPIEDRSARRYTVSLSSEASLARVGARAGGELDPQSFSGDLWVDEGTAVRLLGRVEGVLQRSNYTQKHTLQLARTNIGVSQDIQPPDLVGEQEQ